MNMINVLQRLAELDKANPNVINPMVKESMGAQGDIGGAHGEETISPIHGGTVSECGMMGGSDYHSPASISMTADSGEEIGDMLQAIAQLAGIKKYQPDMDHDMDHDDKEVVVGNDHEMDGNMAMRKMIDTMNADEEMEETYDTTPADPTDVPEFEANKFAYQPNAGGKNKGVTTQPTAMTTEEIAQKLFAEYKEFVSESKKKDLNEEQINEFLGLIGPALAAGARALAPVITNVIPNIASKIGTAVKSAAPVVGQAAGQVAKQGAEIAAKNADKIGAGLGLYGLADEFSQVVKQIPGAAEKIYTDTGSVVTDLTKFIGNAVDKSTILELAEMAVKYSLPLAVILAILYGGKKLIDKFAA